MEIELSRCTHIPRKYIKLLLLPESKKVILIFKKSVNLTDNSRNVIEEISYKLDQENLFLVNVIKNPEVLV